MKAKEYYQKFLDNTENDSQKFLVVSALRSMTIEISDIIKKRNIKSNDAAIAVIKEVNQKANAYIKLVNQHIEDGYKQDALLLFIEHEMPNLANIVKPLMTKL